MYVIFFNFAIVCSFYSQFSWCVQGVSQQHQRRLVSRQSSQAGFISHASVLTPPFIHVHPNVFYHNSRNGNSFTRTSELPDIHAFFKGSGAYAAYHQGDYVGLVPPQTITQASVSRNAYDSRLTFRMPTPASGTFTEELYAQQHPTSVYSLPKQNSNSNAGNSPVLGRVAVPQGVKQLPLGSSAVQGAIEGGHAASSPGGILSDPLSSILGGLFGAFYGVTINRITGTQGSKNPTPASKQEISIFFVLFFVLITVAVASLCVVIGSTVFKGKPETFLEDLPDVNPSGYSISNDKNV